MNITMRVARPPKPGCSLAERHPDLPFQVHRNSCYQAHEVSPGTDIKLAWECSKHPEVPFYATPPNVITGRGCGVCRGRQVVAGFNDLATTDPELAAQMHPGNTVKATEVWRGGRTPLLWICPNHTEPYVAWPRSRVDGQGCGRCAGMQQQEATAADRAVHRVVHQVKHHSSREGHTCEARCLGNCYNQQLRPYLTLHQALDLAVQRGELVRSTRPSKRSPRETVTIYLLPTHAHVAA